MTRLIYQHLPLKDITNALFSDNSHTYAVIDQAICPESSLNLSDQERCYLWSGVLDDETKSVAPLIVSLRKADRFTQWLTEQTQFANLNIFIQSKLSLTALRRHLKKIHYVKIEERGLCLFRFYDPRVISVVEPILDQQQRAFIFSNLLKIAFKTDIEQDYLIVSQPP